MTESTELALIPNAQVEAARKRCVGAIEGVWKAYYDPETGLKLREEQAAVAGAKVSSYIYNLAKYAVEVCPRRYRPDEVFGALCAYAEAKLKERHAVVNLSDALPCWKTYKSNIMGGMRAGLNPAEFPTEYEFRKAGTVARLSVIDTRNAAADHALLTESPSHDATETRATQSRSDQVTQSPERLHIEPVRKFIRNTTIASPLKLVLAQLVVEADYVKKGKEAEAEAILARARQELMELVDKRRIKDAATKLALEPPG